MPAALHTSPLPGTDRFRGALLLRVPGQSEARVPGPHVDPSSATIALQLSLTGFAFTAGFGIHDYWSVLVIPFAMLSLAGLTQHVVRAPGRRLFLRQGVRIPLRQPAPDRMGSPQKEHCSR